MSRLAAAAKHASAPTPVTARGQIPADFIALALARRTVRCRARADWITVWLFDAVAGDKSSPPRPTRAGSADWRASSAERNRAARQELFSAQRNCNWGSRRTKSAPLRNALFTASLQGADETEMKPLRPLSARIPSPTQKFFNCCNSPLTAIRSA
jgi:hypothetical protein